MNASRLGLRNVVSLLFPLAIVACAQLQGLDDYEKVDCVDEGCNPTTTADGGGGTSDVNQPDTTPPATCPPCTDGTVCDQKSLKCVECLPGTKECAPGYFCDPDETAAYKCVLGCGTVQDCIAVLGVDAGTDAEAGTATDAGGDAGAGSLACCNNRCVDTASDGKNCGACNVICGASAACCASSCQDIVSTPTSCGGCGVTCSDNHIPTISCGAKACNGNCETGWGDCNNNKLTDGCETNVATDPDKCGGCNIVCSNNNMATRTCGSGVCNGTCSGTFRDCNNDKKTDGCEIDIGTSAANCGACNNPCSNINIPTPTCLAGACNGTCAAGYSDCDNQKLINGCETKTSGANADPNNCGGCGASFSCSNTNMATRTCNGTCNGMCAANFGDCNMNKLTDGCETRISGAGADPNNCGACNTSCSSNHMATRTCNGTCNGTCDVGWGDCNNNKQSDGCETDTTNDSAKCGASCTACPAGSRDCENSVCVAGTTYGSTTSAAAFIDACAQVGMTRYLNGGEDDSAQALTIPWGFTFYGTQYTAAWASTNAVFGFGPTPDTSWSHTCPQPTSEFADPVVLAYYDDLQSRADPNSGICVATLGAVMGTRRFVVTWSDFAFLDVLSTHITVTMILNEADNTIDVLYGTLTGAGSAGDSVMIGVQGTPPAGTLNATKYSCDQPKLVSQQTKIRYFP